MPKGWDRASGRSTWLLEPGGNNERWGLWFRIMVHGRGWVGRLDLEQKLCGRRERLSEGCVGGCYVATAGF